MRIKKIKNIIKKDWSKLREGSVLNIRVAVLVKSRKRAFFSKTKRKRFYFWALLNFNGLCIKIKKVCGNSHLLVLRSYKEDLNGITGIFFLSAPNIININVLKLTDLYWTEKVRYKLIIKRHHKILRKLRLKFSN